MRGSHSTRARLGLAEGFSLLVADHPKRVVSNQFVSNQYLSGPQSDSELITDLLITDYFAKNPEDYGTPP